MRSERLQQILSQPQLVNSADLVDLDRLVVRYPWCGTFRFLQSVAQKNEGEVNWRETAAISGLYAIDRKKFFRLFQKEELSQKTGVTIESNEPLDKHQPSSESQTHSINTDSSIREEEISSAENSQKLSETLELEAEVSEKEEESGEINIADPLELEIAAQSRMLIHERELLASEEAKDSTVSSPVSEENGKNPTDNLDEVHQSIKEPVSEKPKIAEDLSPFSAWLIGEVSTTANDDYDGLISEDVVKESERELIERFIATQPQLSAPKKEFYSPVNMGKKSIEEDNTLVTETLAHIYLQQGEYDKAISAFDKLSLKYPEKSSYFAALSEKARAYKTDKKGK